MHYRRAQIVCIYKFKDTSAGSSALREQSKDEGKWSARLKKKREKKSSYLKCQRPLWILYDIRSYSFMCRIFLKSNHIDVLS
jgi:hypothetical protein